MLGRLKWLEKGREGLLEELSEELEGLEGSTIHQVWFGLASVKPLEWLVLVGVDVFFDVIGVRPRGGLYAFDTIDVALLSMLGTRSDIGGRSDRKQARHPLFAAGVVWYRGGSLLSFPAARRGWSSMKPARATLCAGKFSTAPFHVFFSR